MNRVIEYTLLVILQEMVKNELLINHTCARIRTQI